MSLDDDAETTAELRARKARYDEAGVLRKAALRLGREALSPAERERLRRRELGAGGRVAEDVTRVVIACQPVWSLLATNGLPQDLSVRGLNAISECLLGRSTQGWAESSVVDVSILFSRSPLHVAALARVIPGTDSANAFDSYRYATLRTADTHEVEPFVVAVRQRHPGAPGDDEIVATMLVAPTFLRHEEELGVFSAEDLGPLEDILAKDLAAVAETHVQLRDAPPGPL